MFNNPYSFYRPGLFSRMFGTTGSINWGNILNNTQKTLGIINQSIPLVYQVKPIINNAKTMFRIADVIKKPDQETKKEVVTTTPQENKPIFYM